MNIHIQRSGQMFGPYTVEQTRAYLKDGRLVLTDLAWYDGSAGWVPLSTVREVTLEPFAQIPPPPPGASKPIPPTQECHLSEPKPKDAAFPEPALPSRAPEPFRIPKSVIIVAGVLFLFGLTVAAWHFVYLPHRAAERAEASELVKNGRTKMYDDKFAEAVSDLEQAVKLDSQSADAWRALAAAHRHMKHWDQALVALNSAEKIKSDHGEVLEDIGFVYFEQEKWAEATDAYERALKVKPDSSNAYYWLGCIHENRREIGKALSAFQKAVDLKPDDKYALIKLGRMQAFQTNWVAASSLFQKAISIDAEFASAWEGVGDVHAGKKEWREAIAAYEKAVQLDPKFVRAWLDIGFISRQVDDLDGALAAFQKAVQLKPDLADGWAGLGVVYRRKEKTKDAMECLQKAVDLNPNSAYIWGGLGYVYADQGKWEDAVKAFDKAEKLGPELHTQLTCGRAYLLQKQGKIEDAVNTYREALKAMPDSPDAWIGLGEALVIQKNWADAKAAFDHALSDDLLPRIVRLRDQAAYEDGVERSAALIAEQKWAEAKSLAEKLKPPERDDTRATMLLERADKEMRYAAALKKANDLVAEQNWLSAGEQLDEALLIKPDSAEALKIRDSIKASVEEARFTAAVVRLNENFSRERYADAIQAGDEALQIRPSDVATRELISRVRLAKDKQDRFDQALTRAASLLDEKKWKEAQGAVAEAQAIRSNDKRAADLKNRIQNEEAEAVRATRASKRAALLGVPVLDAEKVMKECWNADDRIMAGNFENQYKGKKVRYLGTISEIDLKKGTINFQRKGFLDTSYHVRVLLPKSVPGQVNALMKGQEIWVIGTLNALAPPDGSKVLGLGIVASLAGSNSIRIGDAEFVRPQEIGD